MSTITLKKDGNIISAKLRAWLTFDDINKQKCDIESAYYLWTRLVIGRELAKAYFTHEALRAMDDAVALIRSVVKRFKSTDEQTIRVSPGEREILRAGLEAVDGMIGMTSNTERLQIGKQAQKVMEREFSHV